MEESSEVTSKPVMPVANITSSKDNIKIATPDLILTSEDPVSAELMSDLIFENIGGQEIISIARNDIVNGQNVLYSPISNLSSVAFEYNGKTLLPVSNPSDTYFKNFSIRYEDHIPDEGTGPNGETIYFDPLTGDLVINVVNVPADVQVDVRIYSVEEVIDDTIY